MCMCMCSCTCKFKFPACAGASACAAAGAGAGVGAGACAIYTAVRVDTTYLDLGWNMRVGRSSPVRQSYRSAVWNGRGYSSDSRRSQPFEPLVTWRNFTAMAVIRVVKPFPSSSLLSDIYRVSGTTVYECGGGVPPPTGITFLGHIAGMGGDISPPRQG